MNQWIDIVRVRGSGSSIDFALFRPPAHISDKRIDDQQYTASIGRIASALRGNMGGAELFQERYLEAVSDGRFTLADPVMQCKADHRQRHQAV